MGEISDMLIEAQMDYPDLDQTDAWCAYIDDLACAAIRREEQEQPQALPKRRPKKMPRGLWDDIVATTDATRALRRYQGWWRKKRDAGCVKGI